MELLSNLSITSASALLSLYWSHYAVLLVLARTQADFDHLYIRLDRDYATMTRLLSLIESIKSRVALFRERRADRR
jgi:hypothetical protein